MTDKNPDDPWQSIDAFRAKNGPMMRDAKERSRVPTPLDGERVYVAYLDVLGFRKLVETDAKTVFSKYRDLIQSLRNVQQLVSVVGNQKVLRGEEEPKVVGFTEVNPPVIFSDSVFVVSRSHSPEALRQTCHLANSFFVMALRIGLPLKGAISAGTIHWSPDDQLLLGPGITRAYELAESIDCLGVCIDAIIEAPKNSAGPFQFALKGGGNLSMHVPLVSGGSSLVRIDSSALMEKFGELEKFAVAAGNPGVIKKYHASREIIRAMSKEEF